MNTFSTVLKLQSGHEYMTTNIIYNIQMAKTPKKRETRVAVHVFLHVV